MNIKLKEMPPSRPKVNQVQRKYLQDRLRAAERDKHYPELKMPPALKAAQKRIEAWNQAQWRVTGGRRNRVKVAAETARQAILFGTPEEALAAVESFEQLRVA